MKNFLLICIAILTAIYLTNRYSSYSIDDLLPAKPYQARPLTAAQQAAVPVRTDIPAEIYQHNRPSSAWAGPLFGDQKTAFFVYGSGCPYATKFKNLLRTLLRQPELAGIYQRKIHNMGPVGFVTCEHPKCAKIYLIETCGEGFCIINPQKRQMVVDRSQNTAIAAALLEKYRNW